MERRNPGFCAESLRIFERGVEALQLYENCFREEESDFKSQYEQAADLIASMYREGLLEGNFETPKVIEYICANLPCTKQQSLDRRSRQQHYAHQVMRAV